MCSDPFSSADPNFSAASEARLIVIDTNIVLDAFVFNDPASQPMTEALCNGSLRWLATPAMRDELARVLHYPKIKLRLALCQIMAEHVLSQFDEQAQRVGAAPTARVTCSDPDDQKFIDLAVAHQAILLSKDRAVLCLKKRLVTLGVAVQVAILPTLLNVK